MSRNKIDWPSRRHQIVGLGGCYFPRSLQKHRIFSEGVSTPKRKIKHVNAFCGCFYQKNTRQDLITARFIENPGADYLLFSGHTVWLTAWYYAYHSRG